jgi:ApeA N-terminal domain 1
MTDREEITGRWWIHGDTSPPRGGVLSQEGEKLSLKIVNTAGGESVARMLAQSAQVGLPVIPNVVRGRDSQDKPVTLFGCFCDGHSVSQGEEVYEISALTGVQDCEIESWQKPVVRTVFVRLQHFHRWLEMDVLKSIPLPDGKTGWKACDYSEVRFPIAEGIEFRITQSLRHKQGQDGDKFRPDCKICLSFATPRSKEEVSRRGESKANS